MENKQKEDKYKIIEKEKMYDYISVLDHVIPKEDLMTKIRKKLKEVSKIKSPAEREIKIKSLSKESGLGIGTLKEELQFIINKEESDKAQEFLKKIEDCPIKVDKQDYLKCKSKGKDCERILEYWIAQYSQSKPTWTEKVLEIDKFNVVVTLRNEEAIEEEELEDVVGQHYDKSDLVSKIWKVRPFFFDKTGSFWLWRNKLKKWERVDDTEVLNMVSKVSQANTVNSKEKNEILEAMKQYGRQKMPKDISKRWIQFKDVIYDLETDNKFEATPEYFVTNPIPHALGENGETPVLDRIFKEWVGEDKIQLLYEIMAYCMLPDYPLHRIFCFVGSGMNGKSKYLELLRDFIGNENTCSTELDTLLNSRFEVTRVYKKLICQMGETNFSEMAKTSMLKKLSGGDYINYEYKNKTPFEDLNYAKILISTNTLPATTDKTIGFYRRWIIIDFPNTFSEKKDILSEIPQEEMNNLAFKCLGYLRLILQKREFHAEGSVEDRMNRYEERSNPMQKFIQEYCNTSDPECFITKSQLSKKLNDWLRSNGYRTLSDVEINKRMKRAGFVDGRKNIDWYSDGKIGKKLARVWLEIKFKGEKS